MCVVVFVFVLVFMVGFIVLFFGDCCVFCVGGLIGVCNYYWVEIEICVGCFLYYDGGCEDNLYWFMFMLVVVDIVICVFGNISYNVYYLVKSICKKLGKFCVLVKGIGIVFFFDGLGYLVVSEVL